MGPERRKEMPRFAAYVGNIGLIGEFKTLREAIKEAEETVAQSARADDTASIFQGGELVWEKEEPAPVKLDMTRVRMYLEYQCLDDVDLARIASYLMDLVGDNKEVGAEARRIMDNIDGVVCQLEDEE